MVTCSNREAAALAVFAALSVSWGVRGAVYLTVPEALATVFPPSATVERKTAYLSEEELARARTLADVPVESALVHYYQAHEKGKIIGTAYVDTHRVRTLSESIMIVLGPEAQIERIELLSFNEPPEYRAPAPFHGQFIGRKLDSSLSLRRDIRGITGATLTSKAATQAIRRVLAIHSVLRARHDP